MYTIVQHVSAATGRTTAIGVTTHNIQLSGGIDVLTLKLGTG